MPRKDTVYVVVRSDGSVRAGRKPRIATDEVAIKLNLTIPDGWGQVTQEFNLAMPEPPVAVDATVEARDG